MNRLNFNIRKWGIRAMVGLGAALGVSSCSHKANPAAGVYGPPPGSRPIKVGAIEDVYGPPVERMDSANADAELEPKKVDFVTDRKDME